MPIDEESLKRLADNLDRLPKRRKSYSKKQAVVALADKVFALLRSDRSLDSIYWKFERELRISKNEFKETLHSILQAERPDEEPETVLAELISEGRPAVDTTATPLGLERPKPATGTLPEPEEGRTGDGEKAVATACEESPEPAEQTLESSMQETAEEAKAGAEQETPPAGRTDVSGSSTSDSEGTEFGDGKGKLKLAQYE